MTTDHRLTLLACAEKDGKPVHPALRTHAHITMLPSQACTMCGQMCHGPGYVPNFDPTALIAAGLAQIPPWEATFSRQGTTHFPLPYLVTMKPAWFGSGSANWAVLGSGDTLEAALTGALFEATKPLEPDNWGKCRAGGTGPGMTNPDGSYVNKCPCCAGTGIVIKKATNGN